jgi:aminoglycoside/choline kinase family phosphotransferase
LTVDEDVVPNTFRVSLRWQRKHFAFVNLAKRLASYRRVLVHRDFQSQNIIVWNEQAYLIDFQGVRPGLPQYDLASLLFDPYVALTVESLIEVASIAEDFNFLAEFLISFPDRPKPRIRLA